jgi:hypothetical protein
MVTMYVLQIKCSTYYLVQGKYLNLNVVVTIIKSQKERMGQRKGEWLSAGDALMKKKKSESLATMDLSDSSGNRSMHTCGLKCCK